MAKKIFTIGYSIHNIDTFIKMLKAFEIEQLVDIRSIPMSRNCPDYNKDEFAITLKNENITYYHLKELGGLRKPLKDSLNTGWNNNSFRGFADYMSSENFQNGLKKLIKLASSKKTVIMCAEGIPWRCHRSLIADALTLQGWEVFHIQSKKTAKPHSLTSFLIVKDGQLFYKN
ncbi:MAG: hypothetical protein BGO10_09740 [Chlamydia sp. 32-24]|nr:MAG: hypothetical protein BGO10_09740 [Chlamydia sp. 32-24]